MKTNELLDTPHLALKLTYGLVPFLAGADKFFNILADWPSYLSPAIAGTIGISPAVLMPVIGVIEMIVGLMVLTRWTRLGAMVAMAWLTLIAVHLVMAGRYDVAVRDLAMAVGAFTLARLEAARQEQAVGHAPAYRQGVPA